MKKNTSDRETGTFIEELTTYEENLYDTEDENIDLNYELLLKEIEMERRELF